MKYFLLKKKMIQFCLKDMKKYFNLKVEYIELKL